MGPAKIGAPGYWEDKIIPKRDPFRRKPDQMKKRRKIEKNDVSKQGQDGEKTMKKGEEVSHAKLQDALKQISCVGKI